ncbi:MAG TPA: flagellar basal body rod protein FlgC [Syntrophomonadaceae bacterium]|nr:flagellar basal body rod protein FlgC [Syntrophomonadaceae bacterium]
MGFLDGMDISASGLTAQRLRMDTIASNLANAESTRVANGTGPYRRQVVVFEAKNSEQSPSFSDILGQQMASLGGVRVKEIHQMDEKEAPFRRVYEPGHPDADAQGYVNYPNVNAVEEMIDLVSSTRSYQANAQVIDGIKAMTLKALEIGK